MRGPLAILVIVLAVMGLVTPAAPAQDATPVPAGVVLSPDATVDGLSLAEWEARWWQWVLSFPEESNPLFDETGERCSYGQSGSVFFLAGASGSAEWACIVPLGLTILVPLTVSECSTVEPPPYFGRDEAELRACAVEATNQAMETVTILEMNVDGQTVGSLEPYRVSTPLFPLLLPPGNLLGSTAPVANAVANGYHVLLAPLPVGDHIITLSSLGPEGPGTETYRLTVAAPQVVAPAASPVAPPVT